MSKVEYVLNKKMVRGLDYYTKTAFEITAGREGAQSSIGGGGRYDGLIEELGGPSLPGIGFAIGLERVVLTMEEQGLFDNLVMDRKKVYVANVSESNIDAAVLLVQKLRNHGIVAIYDIMNRKLKGQFKYANKINADYVITIGDDEVENNIYPLKNMITGEQIACTYDELITNLGGE
jgi:histidyl-tRNA synthetase